MAHNDWLIGYMDHNDYDSVILLPTGSEERGVLWVGSISVAILFSCQDMKTIAL